MPRSLQHGMWPQEEPLSRSLERGWFSARIKAAAHAEETQAGDEGLTDEQPAKDEGQPKGPEFKKDGEPTGGQ
jgi:hypothetical protein